MRFSSLRSSFTFCPTKVPVDFPGVTVGGTKLVFPRTGGALALADPAADWLTTAVALDATLTLVSNDGRRQLPVSDFVVGPYFTQIAEQEIIERCIYALVNEGAKILEEGIALRASDIDVIYANGYGFPRYRGGPMLYADMVGLDKVYESICRYHELYGDIWEPAPLIKRLSEQGKTFYDFSAKT